METARHWHIWVIEGDHSEREPRRYAHRQAAHRALTARGLQGRARVHECTDPSCPTPVMDADAR